MVWLCGVGAYVMFVQRIHGKKSGRLMLWEKCGSRSMRSEKICDDIAVGS